MGAGKRLLLSRSGARLASNERWKRQWYTQVAVVVVILAAVVVFVVVLVVVVAMVELGNEQKALDICIGTRTRLEL